MKRFFKCIFLVVVGVAATLIVQRMVGPDHQEMAAVKSPDGSLLFVVDRYDSDVPWRSFALYWLGKNGERLPTDGATFREGEYQSGGIDMTNMQIYWRGKTAVADFSGLRLERAYPEDNWRWVQDATPSTRPTSTTAR